MRPTSLHLESLERRLTPALIGPQLIDPAALPGTEPTAVVTDEPAMVIVTETLPGYTPMPTGPVATSPSIIVFTPQQVDWPAGTVPIAPWKPAGLP